MIWALVGLFLNPVGFWDIINCLKKIYWVKIYRNKMQNFCKIGMKFFWIYLWILLKKFIYLTSWRGLGTAQWPHSWPRPLRCWIGGPSAKINKHHEKINWKRPTTYFAQKNCKLQKKCYFLLPCLLHQIEKINHEHVSKVQKYKWVGSIQNDLSHDAHVGKIFWR